MYRKKKMIRDWAVLTIIGVLIWSCAYVAPALADCTKSMSEETHGDIGVPVVEPEPESDLDLKSDKLLVWVNDGGDKVTQDDQRAVGDLSSVLNSVWNGERVTLFGARNEVVSFNLIIEVLGRADSDSGAGNVENLYVLFDRLTGPDGAEISSKAVSGNGVFEWNSRNIELFYIRYLTIKGLSRLSYDATYDERHVPERLRRPWTGEGDGTGTWEDRPDHDKPYPEIAVPLELETPFDIAAGKNQSIWVDIYIPAHASAGVYQGVVTIAQSDETAATPASQLMTIPVELTVRNFNLPDYPSAPTMLAYSTENIAYRYLGESYIDDESSQFQQLQGLIDIHFQVAHRHKISLIDGETSVEQMDRLWRHRLDGTLFTPEQGYDGPGIATGNNVYSVGTYGSWTWMWSEDSESDMWYNTDAWVNWFDEQAFATPTEYFLYLIDESDDYPQIQQWAGWIDNNPGPGSRMMSFATTSEPAHWFADMPSLDIPASGIGMGITDLWETATGTLIQDPGKRFHYYNGTRPASGSFCTEDDGVALRVNGWIQHKKKIDRWFYWESTYYDDYQSGRGHNDLFNTAQTYGTFDGIDEEYAHGQYGWNYMNGDGVLFYPGTDSHFSDSSYGVWGPFASLRLKHWRRGIQDADYLALAEKIDPEATAQLVAQMIPIVLWEHGVENEEDPTYVYADISWSTDPDRWEEAREKLADIIESGSGAVSDFPTPDIKINGSDESVTIQSDAALTVDIALDVGDFADTAADWWLIATLPNGTFQHYDLLRTALVDGMAPMYSGPLFSVEALPLVTLSNLSEGSYVFYFGILISDAASDIMGQLFYDSVGVEIVQ